MNGRIIVKVPILCECCIIIDGVYQLLSLKRNQVVELPYGVHHINVGITYDENPESKRVFAANSMAWENDREILVSEKDVHITIKRRWHLLKHVTAEATLIIQREGE